MRWLRDNWIDALIFTVFAITVVGIVLFLTGVNPFKPQGPVVGPGAGPVNGVSSQPQEPAQTATGGTGGAQEQPETPAVTVVPLLPGSGGESAAGGEEPPEQEPGGSSPSVNQPGGQTAQPATVSRPGGAVKLPGGPEEGVFRVSVGAFSNPDNALSLAEKLQKRGFPVRLEPVGRVTRVVVGPYSTRSKAAEAAGKLTGYDPQVYRGDTPEPKGLYLQVGAYKKLSSAAGLVEKLGSAGVGPVVFYYQEPWLKVWVGPVQPNEADTLKRRLQEMGLQVVEVR